MTKHRYPRVLEKTEASTLKGYFFVPHNTPENENAFQQIQVRFTGDSEGVWRLSKQLYNLDIKFARFSWPERIIVSGESSIAKLMKCGAHIEGYSKSPEELAPLQERIHHSSLGIMTEIGKAELQEDRRIFEFLTKYNLIEGASRQR